MKNIAMKKRIAAVAAAAVVSVSCIAGTWGSTYSNNMQDSYITSYAAESSVVVTASKGYAEGAYAQWSPVSNATGYNVYCDGALIDSMLIRQYAGYFRADAVGLKAGSHTLKIVPLINGSEDSSKAASVTVTSTAYDRTGFAWVNGTGSGAYNEDGTLRDGAVVLYITEETKNTVTLDVVTSSKGATTSSTGLQTILDSYKKGYDTRPLDIRIIGTVTDLSYLTSGDLVVSGSGDTKRLSCGVTIEGIGSDATINGFGIRLKNISNCEIRNIGVMLVDSDEGDNISLQQSCDHVWVHNCDSFYGMPGSDSDQVKGDGALDCKKSTYITFSYNHFWDNGKCNLLGLSEGTTDDLYITYHHNWYDHSDSRHPRVRYYSAHIYNNYYDGNSKYGMGSTLGSSLFAESNYFRNCKYPMLTSMQGSDIATGSGTFSSEDGGTIKAYGNYMEGQTAFVPYSQNNVEFDAYVVSSKTEKVPSTVTSKQGGNTYNNFDTSSAMYSYTADAAADVPAKVMANAGRLDGGDFDFTFTSADDTSYAVNTALMSALQSYTSSVIAIGSGFKDQGTIPAVTTTTAAPVVPVVTTTTTKTITQPPVIGSNVIYCSPSGGGDGKTIDTPTDVLTAISSVQAGGMIYLLGGTYSFSSPIVIDKNNNGSANAFKTISAYPGANVVFDFSAMATSDSNRGVVLDGSYWHFYGFEITKAGDNGMLLAGSNNKIEMMVFSDNQDTGLQLSRYRTDCSTIDTWPSNNYILNCTSKNNCDDETMENADGFAAKLTCGEGNVFDGCMAYNNSDDGWDLYAKTETGPIGVVTIQNCVAFRNGYTEFGEGYGDCDGNGFKLGGSGVGTAHIVKNCLAFENLNCGFTDNNNPELGSLSDCTAYNNSVGGNSKPNFSVYRCTSGCDFTNLMSYYNLDKVSNTGASGISIANDKFYGTVSNSIYYNLKYYYTSGAISTTGSSVKLGDIVTPTESDFITLSVPAMGTDFHTAWRNADGSINTGGFAETSGTYKSLGYHFDGSTVITPVVTTTTTQGGNIDPTTTTTTKTGTPVVEGGYVHDFTANGLSSTFYTISGNLSSTKGTVSYAGKTLTQCLKIETATNITFNAANAGSLTLVFLEPAATVKVDGTKYTSDGSGIITVALSAGSHEVTKADTANLFYMVYAEDSGSGSTTTTSTTTTQPIASAVYGDANDNGTVEIADAVYILQGIADPSNSEYDLTDNGRRNADCYQPGGGVDAQDALAIQQFKANIITALPKLS